jgi:hypothetical protein
MDDLQGTIKEERTYYTKLKSTFDKLGRRFKLDFFVDFEFVDKALILKEEQIPAILMEWAGETLASVLYPDESEKAKPTAIQYAKMAKDFLRICKTMKEAGIVHGDLSAMNVVIRSNGNLGLIDYDGVYIPKEDVISNEPTGGTDGFTHPARRDIKTLSDDNFSQLVIYLTLLTYSHFPNLNKGEAGRDVLLFSKEDIESIDNFRNAEAYKDIKRTNNAELLYYLNELEKAFDVDYDKVPFLCDLHYQPAETPLPVVTMGTYCGRCGHRFLNQTDLYCPDCGKKRETL